MTIASEAKSKPKQSKLDLVSFILLQATIFLAPIFFVPASILPFQVAKGSFIIYAVIALLILWLVARLKDGLFALPKSFFYASSGLLAVAYALATIFSDHRASSVFGQGFEIGSAAFFIPSLALFALVPLLVRSKERILFSYATLLASFFVVAMFQAVRLVLGADALSLGVFFDATANMVGKWNDLGVLLGLSVIMSLVTLEKASLGKLARILSIVCFSLSLALLAIVNFSPVWIAIAVVSLAFFIREFSVDRRTPYFALTSLALSLLFIFAGSSIGGFISSRLGTTQVEVSPSLSMTVDVTKASLSSQPVFGVGPNRFSSQWLLHKPAGVNQGDFWNIDFNYGRGFVLSFAVTTGLVGLVSVLAFLAFFVASGLRMAFRKGSSLFSRYLALSSFVGAAYLWVFSIIYVPGPAIWILTIILSGLFVAAAREDKLIGNVLTLPIKSRAWNFASVLLMTFSIIGLLAFGYFVGTRVLAAAHFQKAIVSSDSVAKAEYVESHILRALALVPADSYYRGLAELELSRIGVLLNDSTVGKEEAQQRFQKYLSTAVQAANGAVSTNPLSYANQVSLGNVLASVIPLKIEGAYEGAQAAYESASALNPQSPEIHLLLARAAMANEDGETARAHIGKALEKKGNYADAIYFLAQMQLADKDIEGAIGSVGALAQLMPSDPNVFFQLGVLYHEADEHENAVLALGRVLELSPAHSNARYVLGLSLYELGETAKSLEQFKALEASNPESSEVKAIVENLDAGRAPFEAAPAPKKSKK